MVEKSSPRLRLPTQFQDLGLGARPVAKDQPVAQAIQAANGPPAENTNSKAWGHSRLSCPAFPAWRRRDATTIPQAASTAALTKSTEDRG